MELSDTIMTKTILFGDSLLSDSTNTLIKIQQLTMS